MASNLHEIFPVILPIDVSYYLFQFISGSNVPDLNILYNYEVFNHDLKRLVTRKANFLNAKKVIKKCTLNKDFEMINYLVRFNY